MPCYSKYRVPAVQQLRRDEQSALDEVDDLTLKLGLVFASGILGWWLQRLQGCFIQLPRLWNSCELRDSVLALYYLVMSVDGEVPMQ